MTVVKSVFSTRRRATHTQTIAPRPERRCRSRATAAQYTNSASDRNRLFGVRRLWTAKASILAALIGLSLVEPISASAESLRYMRTSWAQSEGLPIGSVRVIAQDRSGYLWLGTSAGLLRFDGVRFVKWESVGAPLPDTNVTVLTAARDGSVWLGFVSGVGVSHIVGTSVKSYAWKDGMLQGPIFAIVEGRDGAIWVGGYFGVARFFNNAWTRLGASQGVAADTHVAGITEDSQGQIWLATNHGVLRFDAGHGAFEQQGDFGRPVKAVIEDSQGGLWMFATGRGLRRIDDAPTTAQQAFNLAATNVLSDRNGHLWASTEEGLISVEHQNWPSEPTLVWPRQELDARDEIQTMFEDRENNIWVGTTSGIYRFSPFERGAIEPVDAVSMHRARAVVVNHRGAAWIGTAEGLVRVETNGDATWYTTREGLPGNSITALHIRKPDELWVATNRGLATFNGRVFTPVAGTDRLTQVFAIASNDDGVWLCDFSGLYRWREGHADPVNNPDHRYGAATAYIDRSGRLWVGFVNGGVWVIQGAQMKSYTPADGLPDAIVSSFLETSQGTMLIATTDGLVRFDNGRFVPAVNNLPAGAINSILSDGNDDVWLYMRDRLVRLRASDVEPASSRSDKPLAFRLFDAQDGFEPDEWSGSPIGARGPDGTLWFVSRMGATVLRPSEIGDVALPSPVLIERAIADQRKIDLNQPVSLSPSTIRIELNFTSLTFNPTARTRFRYRLDGLDRDWVDAGVERRLFYTSLPSGKYRLQIAASNLGGEWTTPTVWEFTIRTPFYRTAWFYLLVSIFTGAVVWLIWRQRLLVLQRRYAAVLNERARVGREIHDTLLQGMVGVALQLGAVSEALDRGASLIKPTIDRAREALERYIAETRGSIWELRSPLLEEKGLSRALRELSSTLVAGTGVELRVDEIGDRLSLSVKKQQQLLRIAQEAISNAVRHGRPSTINVDLRYEDQHIVLSIRDNGRGFDTTNQNQLSGWGLRLMRERTAEIAGRLSIASGNAGTEVSVIVDADPAPHATRQVVKYS